jgi:hypothetical protein
MKKALHLEAIEAAVKLQAASFGFFAFTGEQFV